MSSTPLFSRIDTLILRVQDVDRACSWYETTLGLTPVYRDPAERLAVLPVGETGSLTLWELKPGEVRPSGEAAVTYPIFAADDAAADRETLAARGVRVGELTEGPGVRYFTFWDVDGNRLEACQVLSAVAADGGA